MQQIALTGKNGAGLFALVDDEDFAELSRYKWHLASGRKNYPRRSYYDKGKVVNEKLHHWIVGKKDGFVVDHIDGDTLNNQRSNLRHITFKQNNQNRGMNPSNKSGTKGVHWYKGYKHPNGSWKSKPTWVASIRIDGKQRLIGYYQDKENAIEARRLAEQKYYIR